MSAGNYLLYRTRYWLRRQWYKIPWEWRDLVPFIGTYIAVLGVLFGIIYLVRQEWGSIIDNSGAFQMICIGAFSSCIFSYIPDIFNKEKGFVARLSSLALAILFFIWLMITIQDYQIKFLMGL
jgi:hypothetical protein